jgi:hypothetical protein
MMVAHVMGIPVEESLLQLAPAGAVIMTTVAIAGRASLSRLRHRRRRRLPAEDATPRPTRDWSGPTPNAVRQGRRLTPAWEGIRCVSENCGA